MELWAATGNKGKLNEYRGLFAPLDITLKHQGELSVFYPPDETGETFTENARIKAKALAAVQNNSWVFAEDSGLIVDGLGGYPGVHSARYAGPHASDAENRAKLLKMLSLRSPKKREAKFHATVCLLSPEKEESITRKSVEEPSGEFNLLVPYVPEGKSIVLFSSPAENLGKPASIIAEFPLTGDT